MRISYQLKPLVTSTLAELTNLHSVTLRYLATLPGQISICPFDAISNRLQILLAGCHFKIYILSGNVCDEAC